MLCKHSLTAVNECFFNKKLNSTINFRTLVDEQRVFDNVIIQKAA